jgi:hypothetical protein
MSHMKFYYAYAILSMYTSHEEKSRTQFSIDILSFWHYFIWNSVRVNTISQDIIKRLLHDIFHIGPKDLFSQFFSSKIFFAISMSMLGKGQCKICDKKIMTWNFSYRPWYQPLTHISPQLRCQASYHIIELCPFIDSYPIVCFWFEWNFKWLFIIICRCAYIFFSENVYCK